jgi:hypothetical protein
MTFLYPTASTSAIFINGFHVEQAYQLQYKESSNKIPIYGYNNYTYSKIARGKTLVQGILVINFISPNYLTRVLDYQASSPNRLYNYGFTEQDKTANDKLKRDLQNKIRTELPPYQSSYGLQQELAARNGINQRAEYVASLINTKGNTKEIKDALFNLFTNNEKLIPGNVASATIDSGAKDKQFQTKKSPLEYGDSFAGLTLDIYYQTPEEASYWIRFNKVHLYETSQTISQAGADGSSDPLYEIYPWIASNKEIHTVT